METVIRIPLEMRDALAEEAERSGRPADDLVLEALRRYLEPRGRVAPRSFGLHADPAVSGADAEDWLRENRRRG